MDESNSRNTPWRQRLSVRALLATATLVAVALGLAAGIPGLHSVLAQRETTPTGETAYHSRTATLVVAAGDASPQSKLGADFVCDGTADEVEIQAAIDAVPSGRGKVVLTEGKFYIASTIQIGSDQHDITIEGSGWGTELHLAANTTMLQVGDASADLYGFRLTNMLLDGEKATYTTTTNDGIEVARVQRARFDNLWVKNFKGDGFSIGQTVSAYNYILWITHCWIQGCGNDGINASYLEGARITHNSIQTPSRNGITMDGHCGYNDISSNEIENIGEDGIYLNWVDVIRIENNQISNVQQYGIDNNESVILAIGNQIADCGRKTDNTYSCVRLNTANANQGHSLIQGNIIHQPNEGNSAKYCVENLAGSSIIKDNKLSDAKTAQIVDGGTAVISGNIGYVTENSGTATLVNGQTSIVVNHGLDVTPAAGDIMVTPIKNWGNMTEFWIDTYTATQFTIHADQKPGEDVDFAWKAMVP